MYEEILRKITRGEFENLKQAIEEIKKRYKMGMLTYEEYADCRDYAFFYKSNFSKKKFDYVVLG